MYRRESLLVITFFSRTPTGNKFSEENNECLSQRVLRYVEIDIFFHISNKEIKKLYINTNMVNYAL